MKKILVPIDFSDNAENALFVAADIARKSGAMLELLHVNIASVYSTPLSEFSPAVGATFEDRDYDSTALTQLEKIKFELLGNPEFEGLTIQTRVDDGYLHSAIKNVADEDKADLVVMGTKGASGLNEFLVGSNTEKVIRTSPCPVLAVPPGVEKFDPKVVLLPTTLKNDQSNAFRYVAQWQKWYPFLVKALYLNNPSNLPTDGSAEALKNRFAEAAGLTKTDVIMTSESFFEDTTILGYADQVNADLIIMATHQRHGLSHMVFGSITEDTVNHSHIPVLAVPVHWHIGG
ncbi:MAG: universal stress protein [Saprospiraceae bacterium]|nr:universal stress protein [Saprospiraceae bacterium]